jgi:hypothetical protein
MLDLRSARDRAIRRAIVTGQMPNMDIIHARQKMDGFEPCFGRSEKVCQRTGCRWHCDCAELATFRPAGGLGLRGMPQRHPSITANAELPGLHDGGLGVSRSAEGAAMPRLDPSHAMPMAAAQSSTDSLRR